MRRRRLGSSAPKRSSRLQTGGNLSTSALCHSRICAIRPCSQGSFQPSIPRAVAPDHTLPFARLATVMSVSLHDRTDDGSDYICDAGLGLRGEEAHISRTGFHAPPTAAARSFLPTPNSGQPHWLVVICPTRDHRDRYSVLPPDGDRAGIVVEGPDGLPLSTDALQHVRFHHRVWAPISFGSKIESV